MKWLWDKRYALISAYVIGTFAVVYVLKLLLDGAAHFVVAIPAFINGAKGAIGWFAGLFAPLIAALAIAYLLDPAVDLFQGLFDKACLKLGPMPKFMKWGPPKNRGAQPVPVSGHAETLADSAQQTGHKSRAAGVTIAYLALLLAISALVVFIARKFHLSGDYIAGVSNAIEMTKNQFSESYAAFQVSLREMGMLEHVVKYLDMLTEQVSGVAQGAAKGALGIASSLGGAAMNLLLGLIMAFYLLCGKERSLHKLREIAALFLPYNFRTSARRVLGDMHYIFSGYIRGQLTDAAIMAILISATLSIIGVKFAIIIGIFTGFSNIIPYFGAIIGFLLSVAAALLSGQPIKALYAAICILVLQQIDGVFINPRVVGKQVELSPLLVIIALAVGGSMFGMGGMILAVPVCAILKMFLTRYIEYRKGRANNQAAQMEGAADEGAL